MGSYKRPAGEPRLIENAVAPEFFVTGALLPEIHGDHVRVSYYVERQSEVGNPESDTIREVNLHICMTRESFDAILLLYARLMRRAMDAEPPGVYLSS